MANRSRIPAGISHFDSYINTADDYLAVIDAVTTMSHAQRLGLTAPQTAGWSSHCAAWRDNLYPAYTNSNLRTKTVTLRVRNFMADFSRFANPLLKQMAASPAATAADEQVFNFKRFRKKQTRHREPISDKCIVTIQSLGGGEFILSFRTEHRTGRAALAAGADSVQFAFKTGNPAPEHPEDRLQTECRTRSRFIFKTENYTTAFRFHIFCRWYNLRHPELAGPWSELVSATVL